MNDGMRGWNVGEDSLSSRCGCRDEEMKMLTCRPGSLDDLFTANDLLLLTYCS